MSTFSPLSIGSLSVTTAKLGIDTSQFDNFQSPFYRVFECNNTVLKTIKVEEEGLSVPFLSGL